MTNHANALSGDGTVSGDSTAMVDRPALVVSEFPADAFIYPDDPLVLDKFRAALIHPDEPLTPREEEGGIVVGMDGSTEYHVLDYSVALLGVDQVADLLEAVSADLRENGIRGLRNRLGTSTVETILKTYLAEYFSKQH